MLTELGGVDLGVFLSKPKSMRICTARETNMDKNNGKSGSTDAQAGSAIGSITGEAGRLFKWVATSDAKALEKKDGSKGGIVKTIVDPRPMFSFFVGASTHRRNLSVLKELYQQCGFGKYPWSKRAEWMDPPKSTVSFAQAARNAGMDRKSCAATHRRYALTSWVGLAAAVGSITFGVANTLLGSLTLQTFFGAACTATMASAIFFRCSFMSMVFRDRNLDLRIWEWRSRRLEWIPPLDMPFRKRLRSRSAGKDKTDIQDGSGG